LSGANARLERVECGPDPARLRGAREPLPPWEESLEELRPLTGLKAGGHRLVATQDRIYLLAAVPVVRAQE
jgi:hypothetical protein